MNAPSEFAPTWSMPTQFVAQKCPYAPGRAARSRLGRVAIALCLLVLLATPLCLFAQRFEARLFGQDDGLNNLAIAGLAQDQQGFLWVASQNGLSRYDGARFKTFGISEGLSDPSVYNVLIDRKGIVWAGTHNGLFWFDGQGFQELKFEGSSLRVGTNSMMAATMAGEVIVATSKDLFSIQVSPQGGRGLPWSIQPYRVRHPSFPKLDDMNGVGVDSFDTLWVGCGEAICGFHDGSEQVLGKEQGVPPDYYMGLFLARDGSMYVRGRKNIVTWKPGDAKVRDITASLPPGSVSTIHRHFTQDRLGHILTPTASGYASWDGAHWVETSRTSQGDIDGASDIFSDREGNVWIGTLGSGLLESLGYGFWKNYGTAEGLSSPHVFALANDKAGSLWAGHDKGVSRLQPLATSFTGAPLKDDQDATQVQSMVPTPDGGMWVGALLGHIFHVASDGKVDSRVSLDTYIRRLRMDKAATVWVGTSSGLFHLDCTPGGTCAPLAVPDLGRKAIRDLAVAPSGKLWVSLDSGLVSMDPSAGSRTEIRPVALPAALKDIDLLAAAPDGSLWASSGKTGVYRLQIDQASGTASAKVVESHPASELVSDQIVSLDLDRSGRVWIGTDHGFNVLEHGQMQQLNEDDGLIWNDIDAKAFLEDPDGSVWIGTSHGVSHLLDPAALFARPPFAATIDAVEYNERALSPRGGSLWNGGVTLVRFSGLTFRDNRELSYRYSLKGFDSTPVLTHSAFVRFQKLPPGTYTFRVVAEDAVHGVFSSPAEFTFTLRPPWWRTNLFYLALAVLGLCLVVLIWRWSQRALILQRSKLQRLVAERTRELEELAVRDSLTGLLNRHAIMTALTTEIQKAHQQNLPLCIALIDLDYFKQINDTFGHLAGDEVLRRSAERLQGAIRDSDAIGRYGGEEFLIIFRNVEKAIGLERCEGVRTALCSQPVTFESHDLRVTCSIGVAWTGSTSDPLSGLVAKADRAMYLAKENGRNRTECASVD